MAQSQSPRAGIGSNQYQTRGTSTPARASESSAIRKALAGVAGDTAFLDGETTSIAGTGDPDLDEVVDVFMQHRSWLSDGIRAVRQAGVITTREQLQAALDRIDTALNSGSRWKDREFPRDIGGLLLLLHHSDHEARQGAAKALADMGGVPDVGWERIASDPHADVRMYAAHPAAPASVLDMLIADADSKTSDLAAQLIGREAALRIVGEDDENRRHAVLMGGDLPAEVFDRFATSDDPRDREAVATNHRFVPSETMILLAADDEDNVAIVAYACAPHDAQPWPEICDGGPRRRSVGVRQAIARSPYCPPDMCAEFAKDEDHHVRRAAISNPNCPPEVVAKAKYDSAKPVRDAADLRAGRLRRRGPT